MPEVAVFAPGTVNWVDLSSKDLEKSKAFYSKLFGWQPNKIEDPQAGGYTWFLLNGKQISAVGGTQGDQAPTAWSIYFATDDATRTAKAVKDAGGKVVAEPFDVMGAGRMAVFQDPSGAYFNVWEPGTHKGFEAEPGQPNTYTWTELNTNDVDKVKDFYKKVFGWSAKTSPMGEGQPDYTEWQIDGKSIGGGTPMQAQTGAPPHWLVYFASSDVDATTKKVKDLGGSVMLEAMDFPGGRFSIVADPQGGAFGILKMA
ncbi:MAG: VOC family protein [Candidatus Dormibacteraeota bacterium]|nr:VOC family protein [Candidatus Dormibacteraeota bacterium]